MLFLKSPSILFGTQASKHALSTAVRLDCHMIKNYTFSAVKNSRFSIDSISSRKTCRNLNNFVLNFRKCFASKKDLLIRQIAQKHIFVSPIFPNKLINRTFRFRKVYSQSVNLSTKIFPHLSGFVVIDKPLGVSSTEIVRFFQSIVKCYYEGLSSSTVSMPLPLHQKVVRHGFVKPQPAHRRVGHGGTLDPLATGLLVIGIGTATKKLHQFLDGVKEYTAVGRLGNATDSFDSAGSIVLSTSTEHVTRETLEKELSKFTGTYLQTPPIYSAIRVNGIRLYEHARKSKKAGIKADFEIPQRLVTVEKLELTRFWYEDKLDSFGKVTQSPFFELKMRCCKGFYVRSLVHDLGIAVNSSAYTTELRRTAQYPFNLSRDSILLEDCLDLEKFENAVMKTNKLLGLI